MSDMAPWQNKVASCWHLKKKKEHFIANKTVIKWNVLKKFPLCALVEVECIMALYNKGRQNVLLPISSSTNGYLSQKQRVHLKHFWN